jgi:DnaJ-domain-containing protein 1
MFSKYFVKRSDPILALACIPTYLNSLFLSGRRSFASAENAAFASKMDKDYYNILGIPSHSTPEQIKDAYRTLVKKHHPDVRINRGDT